MRFLKQTEEHKLAAPLANNIAYPTGKQHVFNVHANFQPQKTTDAIQSNAKFDSLTNGASPSSKVTPSLTAKTSNSWDFTSLKDNMPTNFGFYSSQTSQNTYNTNITQHIPAGMDSGDISRNVVLQNVPTGYESVIIDKALQIGELEFEPQIHSVFHSINLQFFNIRNAVQFVKMIKLLPEACSMNVFYHPLDFIEVVIVKIPWTVRVNYSQICYHMSVYGDIIEAKFISNRLQTKTQEIVFIYSDSRVARMVPSSIIISDLNGIKTYISASTLTIPHNALVSNSLHSTTNKTPIQVNTVYSPEPPVAAYSSMTGKSMFNTVSSSDNIVGTISNASTNTSTSKSSDYTETSIPFSLNNLGTSESELSFGFGKYCSTPVSSTNMCLNKSSISSLMNEPINSSGENFFEWQRLNDGSIKPKSSTPVHFSVHSFNQDVDPIETKTTESNTSSIESNDILTENVRNLFQKYTEAKPNARTDNLETSSRYSNFPVESSAKKETKLKQKYSGVHHSKKQSLSNVQRKTEATSDKLWNKKESSVSPYSSTSPALKIINTQQNAKNQGSEYIDIEALENGLEHRTTVMVRNIPNKLEFNDFKKFLDETNAKTYHFLYLRFDFTNRCNVGYAFVSFDKPKDLVFFIKKRAGMKWNSQNYNSEKVIDVKFAHIQGFDNLVRKFRTSAVMQKDPAFWPRFYHTDGELAGQEIPFTDSSRKTK